MESWKVAIALSMSSNHASVLSALSSSLLGVHTKVKDLEGGFNRLKLAIGGAFSATAGLALFGLMEKLVDKTKDYSHELAKLENLGGAMGASVVSGEIQKKSFDIAQRVPVKVTDLFKLAGATNSMLGQEETMSVLEDMARFGVALQANKDYKGDLGTDVMKVMRAGELSGRITDPLTGHIDDAKLKHYLDLTTRITAATHGMVGPEALLGLAQQGGVSLRGLSDEGYYHMAIAAQSFGGQRAGTALMSTWQQLATGQMFKRTAEGMEEAGMLKPGEWRTDHGRVIISDDASKRLTAMIGNDPLVFAHQMDENLKAKGIADPQDRLRMIMRGLGRATTQRFTAEEAQNYGQILGETERIKQGYGNLDSFKTFMDKDVESNMNALQNAWTNLLDAVAGPNSQNTISILKTLTENISAMTKSVNGMSPGTITGIAAGIGALAVALTGAGAVAILAALGPAGWIVLGATGVAAAMHALAQVDWKGLGTAISGWFDKAWQSISGWLASHSIADLILSWLGKIIDGVKGLFSGVGKNAPEQVYPGGTMRAIPQSFHPGTGGAQRQQFAFALNVDGDKLAQTMIDKFESKYGFSTGAPSSDGYARYAGVDHQLAGV